MKLAHAVGLWKLMGPLLFHERGQKKYITDFIFNWQLIVFIYLFYKSSPKTQSEIHQKSPSKISNKYHFHILN